MIDELILAIASTNPMQKRSLDVARAQLNPVEEAGLERYVKFCLGNSVSIEQLAMAYNTITADTLREQIFFQRHGRYRYAKFSEVADAVYFNPEYMQRYMLGLALTAYLWPNHLALSRFFEASLPKDIPGKYLEIGPGHGLYLSKAIELSRYGHFDAVDISETSIALTRQILDFNFSGLGKKWHLHIADFLAGDMPSSRYDAIVMGEVLEHVEQPEAFLRRIRQLSNEQTFIFVTTAINAPAVDHIFLFESVEHVIRIVKECGMRCRDYLATPYPGCDMGETVARKLPINIAMVLAPDAGSRTL